MSEQAEPKTPPEKKEENKFDIILRKWFIELHGTSDYPDDKTNSQEINEVSDEEKDTKKNKVPANTAWRATLRRSLTPTAAVSTSACGDLLRRFSTSESGTFKELYENQLPKIGIISAVLSHLKADSLNSRISLGRQMGKSSSSDDKPLINDVRFRRLLKCPDDEQLMTMLVRIVKHITSEGRSIDPIKLAKTILYWDNDSTHQRLAYDYYTANIADNTTKDKESTISSESH